MQKVGDWYVPFDNKITRRNIDTAGKYYHCRPYIRAGDLALDCGAFIGAWTKELQKDFKRVVAVEMDPDNAECVRKNCPDAEVIQGALDCEKRKVFYSPDEFDISPIYRVDCIGKKFTQSIIIDELDLTPNFIKMDLQGFETAALQGAIETLKRAKPILFLEHLPKCYTRYGLDGSELPELLSGLGAIEVMILGSDRIWGWA